MLVNLLVISLAWAAPTPDEDTVHPHISNPATFTIEGRPVSYAPDGHRTIEVDLGRFQDTEHRELVSYDPDLATAPLTPSALAQQPAWVIAVRLAIGEVGPDRLLHNRWGLLEAIAIFETVQNRLTPPAWNPRGIRGLKPWPGCGAEGDFASCANPGQYFALREPRALTPLRKTREVDHLLEAIDVAVEAWWLHATRAVEDVSGGATSFVHRCGGDAYGETTVHCDGRPETPDIPGAHPNTGPLVLKGPVSFLDTRGRYQLGVTRVIDHHPAESRPHHGELVDYLWGNVTWRAEDFATPATHLDALWASPMLEAEDSTDDTGLPASAELD